LKWQKVFLPGQWENAGKNRQKSGNILTLFALLLATTGLATTSTKAEKRRKKETLPTSYHMPPATAVNLGFQSSATDLLLHVVLP